MINVADKVVQKIKTHILCPLTFFFANRAVCEIMWENAVEDSKPQMAIWRMHTAGCIPKATNTHTHSQYVTYCFSPITTVARTRLNVRSYVHWLSCYNQNTINQTCFDILRVVLRQCRPTFV